MLLLWHVTPSNQLMSMAMRLRLNVLVLALHISRGSLNDTHLVHLLRVVLHLQVGIGILLDLIVKSIISLLGNLLCHLVSRVSSKMSSCVDHWRPNVAHWDLFLLIVQIIQEWILDLLFLVLVIQGSPLYRLSYSLELIIWLLDVAKWLLMANLILNLIV